MKAAVWHADVEADGPIGIGFMLDDGATCDELRGAQGAVDGLESRVAVCPIHQHFESSGQRHGMAGDRQAELGHSRLAFGGNLREAAFKCACRIENAGNAFNAQVGIVELNGCSEQEVFPGSTLAVRGPKVHGTVDLARRPWVRQIGVILHCHVPAGGLELHVMKIEVQRNLRFVFRKNGQ